MLRYLPFILILALTIYALVDCVRNDDSGMPVSLPKGVWIVLIVLFPAIGPITWLVVSRASRQTSRGGGTVYRSSSSSSGYQRPGRPSRPGRPPRMRQVAPDDDPEFLASLDPTPPPAAGQTDGPAASDDDADGPAGSDEPDDGRGPHANPGPSAQS